MSDKKQPPEMHPINRDLAVLIAKHMAAHPVLRPTYYTEGFTPHEWVVQAILMGMNPGGLADFRKHAAALDLNGMDAAANLAVGAMEADPDNTADPAKEERVSWDWLIGTISGIRVRYEPMGGQVHAYIARDEVLDWIREGRDRARTQATTGSGTVGSPDHSQPVQELSVEIPKRSIIKPSVGRKVWFWPATDASTSNSRLSAALDKGQPFDATVIFVASDSCVNLLVTDHFGDQEVIINVHLIQPTDSPTIETRRACHATWMPYQQDQAEKAQAKAEPAPQHPVLAAVDHWVNRVATEKVGEQLGSQLTNASSITWSLPVSTDPTDHNDHHNSGNVDADAYWDAITEANKAIREPLFESIRNDLYQRVAEHLVELNDVYTTLGKNHWFRHKTTINGFTVLLAGPPKSAGQMTDGCSRHDVGE